MSVRPSIVLASSVLSTAWGRAFLELYARPAGTAGPLVLSIVGFSGELPGEDSVIRSATDRTLHALGKMPVRVSAFTILPFEMWCRRGRPHSRDFARLCVDRLLPRLKALDQRNRLGTYFERMMAFTGSKNGDTRTVNQLAFVIDLMKNPKRRARQSALQIACFDPVKDHTRQTRRGFPCLQQVGVTYEGNGQIALNAYYPTQFVFDRGYGNYLGLCHLGAFIAHEAGCTFSRLNCFVSQPTLGHVSKKALRGLVAVVRARIEQPMAADGEQA